MTISNRKSLRAVMALFLAMATFFATTISAKAVESPTKEIILGSEEDNPIDAGLVVTTEQTDSSINTCATARSTWQLFSMEAKKVTSLLTTKSAAKYFRRSDLSHGGLLMQGSFTYAVTGDSEYYVRCGACIYDASSGQFHSTHVVEKNVIYKLYAKSEFSSNYIYYGFVQNVRGSSTDYVSGRLTFYDTNEA